jgi:hypothetical protein
VEEVRSSLWISLNEWMNGCEKQQKEEEDEYNKLVIFHKSKYFGYKYINFWYQTVM